MDSKALPVASNRLHRLSQLFALYALLAGAISFSGWPLDIVRLTDWFDDGVSIQPNTAVLIALAATALLLLPALNGQFSLALACFVAVAGTLNLLQYVVGADFGFNQFLLFGRSWGQDATVSPGRFGPPASTSLMLLGAAIGLLSARKTLFRRYIPILALCVVLLMTFSLFGYLFGARNFYAIPWLSAIAFPTSTMFMALAVSVVLRVPEQHPMLLLCERSSAGAMARTVLPILIVMIPSLTWMRAKGYELEFFDIGTGRALGAVTLTLGVVTIMWVALLALRSREQLAREADRRKDEFLATLAHELRNPLAPIRNATSILKLACGDREAFELATGTIERQVNQLVRLIDDLLDASRISRGKIELRPERLELSPIIQLAVETCRPLAEKANLKVTVSLPHKPVYLDADAVRLAQVICNILNNACKFSGHGGQIDLTVERRDSDVVISVKDNGIGIPPDQLDSIFEMFSQLDQTLERSQSGLGIGLSLAKRLVELHRGSIEAHSDGIGLGSEFLVRLPVAVDGVAGSANPSDEFVKPSGKRRILVVDDNRDSATSLATLLRLTGDDISLAHDGLEAIEAAAAKRPDVILLDIGMPGLNGFEACRRIRENAWAEKICIIAVTGWGQEEDRRKSAEAGFDAHLVKPINHAELTTLLASNL